MDEKDENEFSESDFNKMFGEGFNEEKIALEEATKPFVEIFKAYRANGLTVWEAAAIVTQLMMAGVSNNPFYPPEEDNGEAS